MAKLPWKVIALGGCALIESKLIQMLLKNFSEQGLALQTIITASIMCLIGFFFGLWFPKEIELVYNDCRFEGIKGLYKPGLVVPACFLFMPLQSSLQSQQSFLFSIVAAAAISLVGAAFFWIIAIPLRWTISAVKDFMQSYTDMTKDKPVG